VGNEVSELQPEYEHKLLPLITDDKTPNAVKEMSIVLQIEPGLSMTKTRLFLICDDCYWCASATRTRLVEIDSCPQCQKQVSSIPLTDNEGYTYNYDKRHGVEVEFWSSRQRTVPVPVDYDYEVNFKRISL
jgi:hypothetical protein